jgi:hypothetical protein
MEAIWESEIEVGAYGPKGKTVGCAIRLFAQAGAGPLAERRLKLPLPVTTPIWRDTWKNLTNADEVLRDAYDHAREISLTFDASVYGARTIVARRERTPLRWVVTREARQWIIQLMNDGDATDLHVAWYSFDRPTQAESLSAEAALAGMAIPNGGGMFAGEGAGSVASLVVAPMVVVRDFAELAWHPNVDKPAHDAQGILDYLQLAARWEVGRTGGSALAPVKKTAVVQRLISEIFGTLCGDRWRRLERNLINGRSSFSTLASELAPRRAGGRIGQELQNALNLGSTGDLAILVSRIADICRRNFLAESASVSSSNGVPVRAGVRRRPDQLRWLVEFGFMLGSSPGQLVQWAGERLPHGIETLLRAPSICRAIRWSVIRLGDALESRLGH